jgi:hypothetical protein
MRGGIAAADIASEVIGPHTSKCAALLVRKRHEARKDFDCLGFYSILKNGRIGGYQNNNFGNIQTGMKN